MKYTKYDKLIDESYPEKRQAVYERLKKELNLPDAPVAPAQSRRAANAAKKSASKWRTFFKHPARLAACLSAAMAVFCLAIILPFTLKGSGSQTATTPTAEDRFCQAAACKEIELSYSLKEYSARNRLSLLYVDWYAKAEIKTSLHVNNEDQTDIVYYEEILKHKGTGSIVELYITDLHTKVDKVADYQKGVKKLYVIRPYNVGVAWGSAMDGNGKYYRYTAAFKYGQYVYTLVLRYSMSENDIFELIDSMLPELERSDYYSQRALI